MRGTLGCFHPFLRRSSNILRRFTTKSHSVEEKDLRNIGIMAHIDAGKTTTTERMLLYSGRIESTGEVHDGNTITDYMEEERDRGITITSAAISFPWRKNHINLIDTPGHVDFTVEVERALRVLDGAIAVFDAAAGVQPQSLTVWRQADRYKVPRLCYLNKMDKANANVDLSINSIKSKLHVDPLVIQSPIGCGSTFRGVIDIISMIKMEWDPTSDKSGKTFSTKTLTPEDGQLYEEIFTKRSALTEQICDLDNDVAEAVLEQESTENIPTQLLRRALRQITVRGNGVPLLMGSSFKNVGVQPLLDAVNCYLPSPVERVHKSLQPFGSRLCGIVFKIIHHPVMGALSFVRIYSGSMRQGDKLYNINRSAQEKPQKLMIPYADSFERVQEASSGSIIVLTGLKSAVTGDTLTTQEFSGTIKKIGAEKFKLMGVSIPQPVFMCSVEAPSLSKQAALEKSLKFLEREDPSLIVKVDDETGQTVLSGQGELHLEIIRNRIRNEYKVDVDLGPLEVSYRESLLDTEPHTVTYDKTIGGESQWVTMTLQLLQKPGHIFSKTSFKFTRDNQNNLNSVKPYQHNAINRGVTGALSSGPILGYPIIDVECKLLYFEMKGKTAETSIAAAASQCVNEIVKRASPVLMEPIMKLELATPESKSKALTGDLTRRRANIVDVYHLNDLVVINAECPLSELVGYSTSVRIMSSGLASLTMEFSHYRTTTIEERESIMRKLDPFAM